MNPTVVILAGGRGTRLGERVSDVPKPMVEVAGRPFLEYLLDQVRACGYRDILLCVGYLADRIRDYFGDGQAVDLRIRYSVEENPLGTGGPLRLAESRIESDPFLVMNGDSYCGVDVRRVYDRHLARHATATVVVTRVEDGSRFGTVRFGDAQEVVEFREKEEAAGSSYVNAGIYVFARAVVSRLPTSGPASLERDLLSSLVGQGLVAYPTEAPLVDIGTPKSLAAAHGLMRSGTQELL